MLNIRKVFKPKIFLLLIGISFVFVANDYSYSQSENVLATPSLFQKPAKKISVLLIHPRSKYQTTQPEKQPLQLLFLASVLSSASYRDHFVSVYPGYRGGLIPEVEVKILDLQAEKSDFDLKGFLIEEQPDIVGVTAPTQLFNQAAEISKTVKEALPGALRIIGGAHVSALPEETLRNSEFQIGVLGFGEETLTELCMQYAQGYVDAARVRGIVFKSKDGEVRINSARARKIPLSHAPPPSDSLPLLNANGYASVSFILEHGKKRGPLAVLFTARGCPFGCKFCASPSRIVEKRRPKDIVAEMESLYQKGYRLFQFVDDTFSFDLNRAKELCRLIRNRPWHSDIEWIASTRADRVDNELIHLMKAAGCVGIAIGVETGDEALLKEMDKGTRLSDVIRAREICRGEGLSIKYLTMVGLPGQDWGSIKKTVDLILETDPTAVTVCVYTPFPGSPWWGDRRVEFIEEATLDDMVSHPLPHPELRYDTFLVHTRTDVMTNVEISEARQLIIGIFRYRNDPERKIQLLRRLDAKLVK